MRKTSPQALVAIVVAALVGVGAAPAQAGVGRTGQHESSSERAPSPVVLADSLVSPLRLAAIGHGTVVVAQEFAGKLTRVRADGSKSDIYSAPGWDVAGVSISDRTTYFTQSQGAGGLDGKPLAGSLKSIDHEGKVHQIADIAAYEQAKNPDGNVTYGFRDLDKACLDQLPPMIPGSYKGAVDSHPYATTENDGTIYVADAGANAILAVEERTGEISTVAVLPARPLRVTEAMAAAGGIPTCAVGHTYYFEPVPTDVQFGPHGWLFVTSLPGGPEDPSLGSRGSVFKVNPGDGTTRLVAGGLSGATGLAVADNGDIYVAEMFGNRISVIHPWSETAKTFLDIKTPGDVEVRGSTLYATAHAVDLTNPTAPPAGQVIKVALGD